MADEQSATPEPEESTTTTKPTAEPAVESVEQMETRSKTDFRRKGRSPRRGKKLRNHLKNQKQKIAKEGTVSLDQAINLLKQIKRSKFDETVEIHMWLGIDPSHSDQMVRGAVSLPHGLGVTKRVLVFCQGDNVEKAKAAGADYVGGDELVEKIQKENWLDFDVTLTTQDMMPKVSRLGKLLGPRGLMPSPKAGTVIPASGDIAEVVSEFKAGKIEFRADKTGNLHVGVGKLSFEPVKLVENIRAFVEHVRSVKPSAVKGHFIKQIAVSATMSPGLVVAV